MTRRVIDQGECKNILNGSQEPSSLAEKNHHESFPLVLAASCPKVNNAASGSSSLQTFRQPSPSSSRPLRTSSDGDSIICLPPHINKHRSFVEEYVRCYALNLPPPKLTHPLFLFHRPSQLVRRMRTSASSTSESSAMKMTTTTTTQGDEARASRPLLSLSHLNAPPLTAKEFLMLNDSVLYNPFHSLDDPSTLALLGDRKRYRPLLCCCTNHRHCIIFNNDNNNGRCYYNHRRRRSNSRSSSSSTIDTLSCCCCYSVTTVQTPTVYVGETIPMTIVVAHYHTRIRRYRCGRGHRTDWETLKKIIVRFIRCCHEQPVVELHRSPTGRLV